VFTVTQLTIHDIPELYICKCYSMTNLLMRDERQ